MLPGSILIYSFPETSRQETKREIKKKKKKDHIKTKNKMTSLIMFFF